MKIENVKIYGMEESIRASKYPMAVNLEKLDGEAVERTNKLGTAEIGSGHDNFLNGIVTQFDLTASIKFWQQIQRYHFLDIVSSQSTMHRIKSMDIAEQCCGYVDERIIVIANELQETYNAEPTLDNFLKLIYNIPVGFEITARVTTNYRQLKTIYKQRKGHRLLEWRMFCEFVEKLEHSEWVTQAGGINCRDCEVIDDGK